MKKIIFISFLFLGCAATKKEVPVAVLPKSAEPQMLSLFTDIKASRLGDLITVQIVENARGSKKNTSKANKKSDQLIDLQGDSSDNIKNNGFNLKTGLKTKNNYDADSGLEKQANLVANVTAMVTEVFPNGNLKIEGQQEITLDRGLQTISVSGIARPEDISGANTIPSIRLANAKISYKSKNEPNVHHYGLLGWLFSLVF